MTMRAVARMSVFSRGGMWLLLLAVVLRALVPVGFMPDAAALRDGRIAIEICTQGGGVAGVHVALARAAQALQQEHAAYVAFAPAHAEHGAGHGDGDGAAQECPFWLATHQVADLSAVFLPPLFVALVFLAGATPVLYEPVATRPAGPPLGPRAPPAQL
jgi:hypothetical protein